MLCIYKLKSGFTILNLLPEDPALALSMEKAET